MQETAQHLTVFDPDQQQLGDVYAKALLGFGQQSGNIDGLVDELGSVVEAVNSLPSLRQILESPRVSVSEKTALVEKAFRGRVSDPALNFLKIVCEKGRFDCLGSMHVSAVKLSDEAAGRTQATLTTAEWIDDSVRDNVAQKLSSVLGQQVSLKTKVDPEIIGGMVVRVGDTVYDASVQNQLKQVRGRAIKQAADSIREQLARFATNEE